MQTINADPQRKIIHAKSHWLNLINTIIFSSASLLYLVVAILTAFHVLPSKQGWIDVAIPVGLSLVFFSGAFICWFESQKHMASSPAGLEVRSFGSRTFCRWDDLDSVQIIDKSDHYVDPTGIKYPSTSKPRTIQVLQNRAVLIQSIVPEEFIEVLTLCRLVEVQRFWRTKRNQTRKVDLTDFRAWRDTPVGQDIRRYASQMIDYKTLQ